MSEQGVSLPTKVLFIVYKMEWWGCLGSLCRQECLKQDTLVYVMLVPYYERDPHTTEVDFTKKHFLTEQLETILPQGAIMADYQEFLKTYRNILVIFRPDEDIQARYRELYEPVKKDMRSLWRILAGEDRHL